MIKSDVESFDETQSKEVSPFSQIDRRLELGLGLRAKDQGLRLGLDLGRGLRLRLRLRLGLGTDQTDRQTDNFGQLFYRKPNSLPSFNPFFDMCLAFVCSLVLACFVVSCVLLC